jgi:hypothetical protein
VFTQTDLRHGLTTGIVLLGCLAAELVSAVPAAAARPVPAASGTAPRYVVDGRVSVPGDAGSAAVDPMLQRIYVGTNIFGSGGQTGQVELIAAGSRRVLRTFKITHGLKSELITAVAVDPGTHRFYVLINGFTQGGGPSGPNEVIAYSAGGRQLATMTVGPDPESLVIDSVGRRAYAGNSNGTVSVLNLTTNRNAGGVQLPAAATIGPLAVDHATHRLVVAFDPIRGSGERLAVVNAANRRILRVYNLGGNGSPYGTNESIVADPTAHSVYVGAFNDRYLRELNLRTLTVTTPFTFPSTGLFDLVFDSATDTLFVALPGNTTDTAEAVQAVDLATGRPNLTSTVVFRGSIIDNPISGGVLDVGAADSAKLNSGTVDFIVPRT